MDTKLVFAILGLLLLAGAVYYSGANSRVPWGGEKGCTLEAKICPDGTAVGRTGPNCEFAACPNGTAGGTIPAESIKIETRIGQGASALDVKVVPVELIEDSRCPAGVQCIQAGTVRVRATLESGLGAANQVFELGKTITTEVENVTLVEVLPAAQAGVAIPANQYRFIFEIKKRTDLPDTAIQACAAAGGKWLAQYNECEGLGADGQAFARTCALAGGVYNGCSSACRHDPNPGACIMLCVPVCQF